MRKSKKESVVLLFILAAGLLLRLWGVHFGLPYQFHQDEPIVVNHALAYGTGDFNPHFFIIPPLASYILFFFYVCYFGILKLLHIAPDAQAFALRFFTDATPFYLIARLVLGVAPSILSVYATYRLALRLLSRQAALCAAALMAVTFLNTVHAHYAYTDNMLVMFILAAFLSLSRWQESAKTRDILFFGICAGLATATKYNAALLLCSGLAGVFMSGARTISAKTRLFLLACAASAAAFILANPYALLDHNFFFSSVTGRIRHGYIGFGHHIRYSLFEGMGEALTAVGLVGFVLLLRVRFRRLFPGFIFFIGFFIHLVFASQPFPRYVLALIPFVCIGAAHVLFDVMTLRRRMKGGVILFCGLCAALLIPTAIKSVKADILLSTPDTRIRALGWIEENVPQGSLIALDHTFFSPPLKQTVAQLRDKRAIFGKQPELARLKDTKLTLQMQALLGRKTYRVYYLIEGGEHSGQFLTFWPVLQNTREALGARKVEYVIFSNMNMLESTWQLHQAIAREYEPAAFFNPYRTRPFRAPLDEVEMTCIPVGTDELLSRHAPGPYLVVYKLRE